MAFVASKIGSSGNWVGNLELRKAGKGGPERIRLDVAREAAGPPKQHLPQRHSVPSLS
jgi:hypothetical protein